MKQKQTLNDLRVLTRRAGCVEEALIRLQEGGTSRGKAIRLMRVIDPTGFNHWSAHERGFFENERRRLQRFENSRGPSPEMIGFRFRGC